MGDSDVKPEILKMHSCNFDGDSQMESLSGSKAERLTTDLSKAGFKLGKLVSRHDGLKERSLFIQSISCAKTIEYGQTADLKEKMFELHNCSVEF